MARIRDTAMAQQSEQDKPNRKGAISIPGPEVGIDEELFLQFSGTTLFLAREAVQVLTNEQLLALLEFISETQRQISELQETKHPNLDVQRAYIKAVAALTQKWAPAHISEETPEERALVVTYSLLRSKAVSHEHAANIASTMLGKTYSAEAWRKKLERWAQKHELPKIEKRRPDRK